MKIIFSRHAKRRIQLYDIPESIILEIFKGMKFSSCGKQEIIKDVPNFKLPIKIVFDVQDGIIKVITAYPLKKRIKNENIL